MKLDLVEILSNEIAKRGITAYTFSKQTGIKANKVYAWLKGEGNPKSEDSQIIEQWLNEEIAENSPANGKSVLNGNKEILTDNQQTFLQKRRQLKADSGPYMVPFVPIKAQAGYTRAIDQTMFLNTLEPYPLLPGVDPAGAVWRYWEVEGDSMETVFHSGDVVLSSQVPRMDWTDNIRNFYVYIIVTHDRVMIKRLFAKSQEKWVIISENESQYPQFLLNVEDVKELWVFRRKIDNKAAPTKRFEITV